MASTVFDVVCPCCQAMLRVDQETGVVLSHKQPEKPPVIEDIGLAASRLKGEAARREEAFKKSLLDHKNRESVLNKKFDELFKQAKEDPKEGPPPRAFDLD